MKEEEMAVEVQISPELYKTMQDIGSRLIKECRAKLTPAQTYVLLIDLVESLKKTQGIRGHVTLPSKRSA